jgi:hypothetical protein
MAQPHSARAKKGGKWGSITYLTVQIEQTRLIRCLLYGSFQIEKRFGPYEKLPTANWTIVDHNITLPYNNVCYWFGWIFRRGVTIIGHYIVT